MSLPDQPTPPTPAKLRPAQVPWMSSKPATGTRLKKLVPKAAFKPATTVALPRPAVLRPSRPPQVGPATPTAPAAPLPPLPSLTVKHVPWSSSKKPAGAPAGQPPGPTPPASTWALPRMRPPPPGAPAPAGARPEGRPAEAQAEAEADRGPTAAQLVALLSRRLPHPRGSPAPTPLSPYQARPISFAATPWDVIKMWISTHRVRLGLAGVGLALVLGLGYLQNLLVLDASLDRQWRGVEATLRQRYALAPAYLDCLTPYGSADHYTVALTEKAQREWRSARTETELAAAAPRMEHVLSVLAQTMKHFDQNGVAKDDEQLDSSARFVRLEQKRERSRALMSESVPAYNRAVEDFNARVLGVPGGWLARLAGVQARPPLFEHGRAP